jgi:hypothetical protein
MTIEPRLCRQDPDFFCFIAHFLKISCFIIPTQLSQRVDGLVFAEYAAQHVADFTQGRILLARLP